MTERAKWRQRLTVGINIVSAAAAVVGAAVAFWQALDARQSSDVALKAALTSQRVEVCIRMHKNLETASTAASWGDFMEKPHSKNAHFMTGTAAVHFLGEDATLFRQMTPGPEAEKFLNDAFRLRIMLKDMVADGSDFMTSDQIRSAVSSLSQAQQRMCDRMVAPPGGF